ncbi:hypothetical protein AcetOrient_orf02518 [Acetobacter orientalis]|uniref:Uncharacterized protein n=1 Tax=Acetobacter orientalis TaxID=146474 RepID=A0A2Z5ZIU7_9PROT|nr:hypothetical protein AcetOrient_orf02518 [Acetobacter orientalis]
MLNLWWMENIFLNHYVKMIFGNGLCFYQGLNSYKISLEIQYIYYFI